MTTDKTLLIAIGGNSLILEGQRGTIAEQFENSRTTARQVGALVSAGWRVVVTHGNGPQVGFILQPRCVRATSVDRGGEGGHPVSEAGSAKPGTGHRG